MGKRKNIAEEFIDIAQGDAAAVAAEVDALILNIDAYEDRVVLCKGTEEKLRALGLNKQDLLKKMKVESQITRDAPLHDSGFFYEGDAIINWVTSYKRGDKSATLNEILDPKKRREYQLNILVQVLPPRVKTPRRAPYVLEEFSDLAP